MKKIRGNKKGFTLVELIVVIVIILVLAAVLVPSLLRYVGNAGDAVCAENRHTIYVETCARYASGEAEDMETAFNQVYKEGDTVCPSGGTYGITVAADGQSAVISCTEHGEQEETNDDETSGAQGNFLVNGINVPTDSAARSIYDVFASGWYSSVAESDDGDIPIYYKVADDYILIYETKDVGKSVTQDWLKESEYSSKKIIRFKSEEDNGEIVGKLDSKDSFNSAFSEELGGIVIDNMYFNDNGLLSAKYSVNGSANTTYNFQ